MRCEVETKVIERFISEVHPEIWTMDVREKQTLEWADGVPVVYRIIREAKSKAWGRTSSHYMGGAQGADMGPDTVLYRVGVFRRWLEDPPQSHFFEWSARFTLEHYDDKGFCGGFFQQFDGQYSRGCAYLDYTPATLAEVVRRFKEWCDIHVRYETREIWIDKKPVPAGMWKRRGSAP